MGEEERKLRSNNRNNLRIFGIDLNLYGEALHEPSSSQSPSSDTFDPRRWSAAVVPDKNHNTINASYILPAQKSQKRSNKIQITILQQIIVEVAVLVVDQGLCRLKVMTLYRLAVIYLNYLDGIF